jgi:hypothetical protein
MFKRLFSAITKKPVTLQATDVLAAQLAIPLEDRDVSKLVPIVLPVELLAGGWPGPIVQIGQLPFAVAWAVVGEMNSFVYVNHAQATFWDDAGISWRKLAFENLCRMSEGNPATGEKLDDSGNPFVQVLLHNDAFGPSRLLIPNLFDGVFGPEYRVSVPEQTCAIIYRTKLTEAEAAEVDAMISGCFQKGTEPMSSERFRPNDFWALVEIQNYGAA